MERDGRNRRVKLRPAVETLEARELLSATASASSNTSPQTPTSPSAVTDSSATTDFSGIVQADQTRTLYGIDGNGETVAVIDTGINYDNESFGGGGFGPGHKVVAGFDFADNTPDPTAIEQHGTAVAGLIASNDPAHLGIAPGADVVSLRVFNSSDVGSFPAVASALQWVISNYHQYNITAVNISLTDGGNYTSNVEGGDGGVGQQITSMIALLDALNIPVIAATGNDFNGQQGEAFPAIVPDAISVTSTDAKDQLVSDAQRLGKAAGLDSATDLAAPGANLTAPVDGNNFATVNGTSFATPLVTGAVLLLQELYESRFGRLPAVADLDGWLQQGADPVDDPVTGITIGRLDILKAAALVPQFEAQSSDPSSTPSNAPGTSPLMTSIITNAPTSIPSQALQTTPVKATIRPALVLSGARNDRAMVPAATGGSPRRFSRFANATSNAPHLVGKRVERAKPPQRAVASESGNRESHATRNEISAARKSPSAHLLPRSRHA